MIKQDLKKENMIILRVLRTVIIFCSVLCYSSCSNSNNSSTSSTSSYSSSLDPKAGTTLKFDVDGTVYTLTFEDSETGSFFGTDGTKSRFSYHDFRSYYRIKFSQNLWLTFKGYKGSSLAIKDGYVYLSGRHAEAKDTELGIKLYR